MNTQFIFFIENFMPCKINIYEYLDYRSFLKDYYHFQKTTAAAFSYRQFSRMAGFRASNILKLVMEGKRNLSQEAIYKFAKALKFNAHEMNFFELLVHFNQAKTHEEKNRYHELIQKSKTYQRTAILEERQYAYFSNWHFVALRELVTLKDFREELQWINRKLKTLFSQDELTKAIQLLTDLKLLFRNAHHKLSQVVTEKNNLPEMGPLVIANFHREMFKKALEAFESTPRDHRDISTATIAVSKAEFLMIKERLHQAKQEIYTIASQAKNRDAVYQLNIQWFNLSEVLWS